MAKKKCQRRFGPDVEYEVFESSKPIEEWPDNVGVNDKSVTGYSHGQLIRTGTKKTGYNRVGFEVRDGDYLVYEGDKVHALSEEKFLKRWRAV